MSTNTDSPRRRTALDGRRLNAFAMDPQELIVVGHDTDDGPEHPLYDERVKLPLDEAMVLDIMDQGVLQPVLSRKDGDRALVVAGRRRVLHAREANQRLVAKGREPVLVPVMSPLRGTDADMLGVMISENEIRRDDEYRVKAEKARRLVVHYNQSESWVARRFGVSEAAVRQWLAFFDLSPRVQQAVADSAISASAAVKLASLSRGAQDAQLGQLLAEERRARPVSSAQVARAKRVQAGKSEIPSRATLRKVARHAKSLPPDFVAGVRWALGDLSAADVKGLRDVLDQLATKQ